MKICRFQPLVVSAETQIAREPKQGLGLPKYGILEGEEVFEINDPFQSRDRTDKSWPLAAIGLLAPAVPSKIVCLGRNYAEHAAEMGNEPPKEPLIFLKPPSAIIAPEEPIVLTPLSSRVDYEGELAIVIGKKCSRLGPFDDARPYILGYSCLNDVTARDLQKKDVQFTRAKSFDTFCPFGPFMETELDLSKATIETFVNGNRKQTAYVQEMIFSVDVIIRWISHVMTLLPSDVISTGTPSGVGPLAAGDMVEVSVSGIGVLRNPVVASQ
jgi:2-keto-4-pentenoate hydratase/2-oxohepta-3-ene-1,7-dioic acid hydratase in catechol pathway